MAKYAACLWPIADPASAIGDFFDHAQRFFCSAAIIAKFLYAKENPDREQRSWQLRDLIDLDDNSPLAKTSIRNGFEHIDERIDNWVATHPQATRYTQSGVSRTGEPQSDLLLRHYDSAVDVFSVWDAKVKLRPVVETVRDVQARVVAQRRRYGA